MRLFILSLSFLVPSIVVAQGTGFVPLIGIPGLTADGYTVNTYLQALFVLTISLAAFAAVVQLIVSGLMYMLSDIVTNKEQAKKRIRNALIGLLIVLSSVLILETINPQLTRLNALDLQQINVVVNTPYAEPVVTSNEAGLDVVDLSRLSNEAVTQTAADCRDGANGTAGQWVVRGNNTGYCVGTETSRSTDNIINQPEVLDPYISENNLNETEIEQLQQRFNQFVAAQEPEGLTAAQIEQIRTDYNAEAVVFVVEQITPGDESQTGYFDSQIALCQELTGFNNLVVDQDTNYVACLR